MENEKRILLAIVLSIIVLVLYQSYFMPAPPQKTDEVFSTEDPVQPKQNELPSPMVTAPPSMTKTKIAPLPKPDDSFSSFSEEYTSASTNIYKAVFSSNGARLKSVQLLNYIDQIPPPALARFFYNIFSSDSADNPPQNYQTFKEMIHVQQQHPLPLRTSFIDSDGNISGNTPWHSDKDRLLIDSSISEGSLSFAQTDPQGISMKKDFIFHQNSYIIDFTFTLSNSSKDTREGNAFVEWTALSPEQKGGSFFGAGTTDVSRFAYLIKDKVEKKELTKIEDPITLEGDILWTSIEEKYFTSAIIPKNQKPAQVRIFKVSENVVAYQLIYPLISLKSGQEKTYTCSLYLGPKEIDILKSQGCGLEKTIDFGWFDIISKPLLLIIKFFYKYLGNYGLSIILLTIIIKIIFWPLTHKSFKSMKGMQAIQPEITKLKEKYKDNKEEFAKQQMGLYKKYKVNPLGGCLPMLLQIPVFIALYRALMDSIELRHANFISFWINDLSAKDPTYIAPIVMGASMFLQQKMTPTSADPTQAKMMMFMPIIFTVMFLSFPSGLVIYWLVNNVLSIAQQLYINKQSNDAGGKECSPPKSKQKLSKKQSR